MSETGLRMMGKDPDGNARGVEVSDSGAIKTEVTGSKAYKTWKGETVQSGEMKVYSLTFEDGFKEATVRIGLDGISDIAGIPPEDWTFIIEVFQGDELAEFSSSRRTLFTTSKSDNLHKIHHVPPIEFTGGHMFYVDFPIVGDSIFVRVDNRNNNSFPLTLRYIGINVE